MRPKKWFQDIASAATTVAVLLGAHLLPSTPLLPCTPGTARAEPKAKTAFKKVETMGWRAELPANWTSWLKEKRDPARPHEGTWGYRSPGQNFRLRVKVRAAEGKSWKERTKTTFEKLYKRMPDFGLLASKSTQINGRELFYVLGRITQKRVKNDHDHLIFRMLVRFPNRKLRVVATFITADERVDDVLKIVERFADTFELVDLKSTDEAGQQAGGANEEL